MFQAIMDYLWVNARNWQLDAEAAYRRLFLAIAIWAGVLVTIAFVSNASGHYGVNVFLAVVWPAIVAAFALQPTYSVGMLGLNQTVMSTLRTKYARFFVHTALFGSIFFLTTALVSFRENPGMAGLIIAGLVIVGIGILHFGWHPKYYERYTVMIALVAIVVGILGGVLSPAQRINLFRVDPFAYFHVPADKDVAVRALQQLERNREKSAAKVQHAFYTDAKAEKDLSDAALRKVVAAANGEVEVGGQYIEPVSTLASQFVGIDRKYVIRGFRNDFAGDADKLCGFEPGKKYRFEVKGAISVRSADLGTKAMSLNGTQGDAHGQAMPGPEHRMWALMIGNTLPNNGEFKTDERGCEPTVVININSARRSDWQLSGAQEILVTFYGGLRL